MGQQQFGGLFPRYGCCVPSQNPDFCQENRSRIFPLQRQKSNLSATFNFSEAGQGQGQGLFFTPVESLVNINTASEEELMTLSGINRQTAANIVTYRHQIGAFRRVEDLALVSGIGATRLENLRYEISVTDRVYPCNGSASGVEADSVSYGNGSCHNRSGSRSKVNVNSANIFQLMKVKFVTQAIAENIVMYRETKGLFLNLDELSKVKGMKPSLLSSIKPFLVLHDSGLSNNLSDNSTLVNGEVTKLKRSFFDECPIISPLQLGSVRSKQPTTRLPSNSVLRFATWSLERCGLDKVENPGVQDVVAMTILENGINLLALQDFTCGLVLQKLCDALNFPTLYNVRAWPNPKGRWKSIASVVNSENEQESSAVGFMFNTDLDLSPVEDKSRLMSCFDKDSNQSAICYVVDFLVNGLRISFANFSFLSKRVSDPEFHSWKDLINALQDLKSGNPLIFSGEYTSAENFQDKVANIFEETGFLPIVSSRKFTDISCGNLVGSKCSENIFLCPKAYPLFTGYSVIIREGLSSPWIPNGWQWDGMVSSHCPVLLDLLVNEKSINKLT